MSWSLSASGRIDGTQEEQAAAEQELVTKLREVLSDPRYGCTGASFSGQHTGAPNLRESS